MDPVNGAHFGRPWYQRHGYGRVYHVSGYGSQLRLLGASDGEAKHSRHAAKTDIPLTPGGVPPGCNPPGRG